MAASNVTTASTAGLQQFLGRYIPARVIFDENINKSNIVLDNWSRFPGLPFALPFERNTLGISSVEWMHANWLLCFYIAFAYVMVVFVGRSFMASRSPYNLRTPLLLWNILLALFSLAAAIRTAPEFVHVLYTEGMERSFCSNSYYHDARLIFWYVIFAWSKVFELIDTVFIVLRKQKLLLLHWLHHALTLCYTFLAMGDVPGTARWMVAMNSIIHSVMYTYYALKVLKVSVPRVVAMFITVAQIAQMIVGLYVNYRAYSIRVRNAQACHTSEAAAFYGFAIYALFFFLFVKFFIASYLPKKTEQEMKKKKKIN